MLVFVGLLPEDSENHLIKRVIGLPGDHVQSDGDTGPIRVNGVPVTEPYVKPGDVPERGQEVRHHRSGRPRVGHGRPPL